MVLLEYLFEIMKFEIEILKTHRIKFLGKFASPSKQGGPKALTHCAAVLYAYIIKPTKDHYNLIIKGSPYPFS